MSERRLPLWVLIVSAIGLGIVVGWFAGPRAAPLGELGVLVVRVLKALATPLVFFAIVDSLVKASLPKRQGLRLLALCLVNTTVAALVAISLAAWLQPGAGAHLSFDGATDGAALKPVDFDFTQALTEIVPESIGGPFVKNQVLAVVLLAVIAGAALRSLTTRGSGQHLVALCSDAFSVLTVMLGWVVKLVPLAIFGVVAKVVGTTGFSLFASLGKLVFTVSLGLLLQVAVWYSILLAFVARRNPWAFFRRVTEPLLTALSAGSSMATLPVTLDTLEHKLNVSPASARLAACIGTNFNNDGIMLYEVVAALFVAQVSGIELSAGQTVTLALTSALAAAGIAGVPEAGLITLSLVLHAANLPLGVLPVLLSVDWLLGRLRATTNVASDLTIATTLDRWHEETRDT